MKTVAAFMRANNLNQSDMARKIGVDRFVMSRWLAGKRKPSNKYLWRMAYITGQDFVKIVKEWE